jgi:hypothetical protein
MDLESLSALTSGGVCFFYGLYALVLVMTRSGCDAKQSNPALSVFKATLYIIITFLSSGVLFFLFTVIRGWQGGGQLQTHGSVFGSSAEGNAWRGYALRYFVISALFCTLVFYWLQNQLVGPLEECAAVKREAAPNATDLLDTMGKLKNMVYLVVTLYAVGFLVSFIQHQKFEQSAGGQDGSSSHAGGGQGILGSLFGGGQVHVSVPNLPSAREVAHARQQHGEASREHSAADREQMHEQMLHFFREHAPHVLTPHPAAPHPAAPHPAAWHPAPSRSAPSHLASSQPEPSNAAL